jgi:hypothetical protein
MNILPFEQQAQVIASLVDGCSIRATERMTGVHRDTIMRLAVRVGEGCARIHDEMMRGLQVNLIEMDEAWAYIGKKQKRLTPDDSAEKGDCYAFIAMDATRKAILSYRVGKRDGENTVAFCQDLRDRIVGRPQISSDAWGRLSRRDRARFRLRGRLRSDNQDVQRGAASERRAPLFAGLGSRRKEASDRWPSRKVQGQHVIHRTAEP